MENSKQNNNEILVFNINGETFLLKAERHLTMIEVNDIEVICNSLYSEESALIKVLEDGKEYDDIYYMTAYEIAELLVKVLYKELNIRVKFVPILAEFKVTK